MKREEGTGNQSSELLANETWYGMLFRDSENINSNTSYWLTSTFNGTAPGRVSYGIRQVLDGLVAGVGIYGTNDQAYENTCGVRAVVYLNADIELTANGNNAWKIQSES